MFRLSRPFHRVSTIMSSFQPHSKNMSTLPDFDFVVIGCGSGGIATARRAASYKHADGRPYNVAVIERDPCGGTCVRKGCVPVSRLAVNLLYASSVHDSPS